MKETAAIFLPDGKVPEKFSRFVQKNLADTLKQLGANEEMVFI